MGERSNDIKVEVHDVKLEEEMEIMDVFEQFTNEKGGHQRDECLKKHGRSISNFLIMKEDPLSPASFTKGKPQVSDASFDMAFDDVKLEEKLDVFEQFVDVKGVHEREGYIKSHENSNLNSSVARINAMGSTSSPTEEITSLLHPLKNNYESINLVQSEYGDSQIDTGEENNLGKIIEKEDISSLEDNMNVCVDTINLNIKKENTTEHKCNLCEYAAARKDYLLNHIKSVHFEIKEHRCHLCEYASTIKARLQRHINSVHFNIKEHKCHICEHATTNKRDLQRHIDTIHLNIKQYKCHLCDYASSFKFKLKSHVKSVHLNIEEKCHLCDYAASTKNKLRLHIDSVHLNSKRHKCHLCDYAANQKTALTVHVKSVHLNIKEKCNLCDYATSFRYNLKHHVESVHFNIKKYKCHLCDHATNRKDKLDVHVKSVHLNIKEHRCQLCEYGTNDKRNLQRHMDTLHLSIEKQK